MIKDVEKNKRNSKQKSNKPRIFGKPGGVTLSYL
jgi:hypothetical protein